MNVIELPLYEDQYYTYTTNLEGARYSLTFLWNERDGGWRMDILKEDRTPILLGYKIVSSYPMLADYSLNDDGISGYMVLLPKSKEAGLLRTAPSAKAQYYRLYYIYE
jgi:hypothetical protein